MRRLQSLAAGGALALLLGTVLPAAAAGSWSIVTSPNPSPSNDQLLATTCASGGDCWAVGWENVSGDLVKALIEHNTGAGWAVDTTAVSVAGDDNFLFGVACGGPMDCWAVGYHYNGSIWRTLVEHTTGSGWALDTTSPAVNSSSYLQAVTCVAVSDCWAVGYSADAGNTQSTLVEHNTGAGWAVVPSANVGTHSNFLQGVACTGASSCWAVGGEFNGAYKQPLIEQYSGGSSWTVAANPVSTTFDTYLQGVTCASALECWAVGTQSNFHTFKQTLIEHTIGSGWSVDTGSANVGTRDNVLNGVTCSGLTDCWAVGNYFDTTTSSQQTLVEHHTVTGWSLDSSANAAPGDNFLQGVACPAAAACWSVGHYRAGTHLTLIERNAALSPAIPEWPAGPLGPLAGLGAAALAVVLSRRWRR